MVASRILEPRRRKEILSRTKKHLNHNLDILLKWGESFSELQFSRTYAAITFAKINMPLNCDEFIFDLRDNYNVLLAAVKWYGLEGFVRFGYRTPTN